MEHGLAHLPKIVVRDTAVEALCSGAPLAVPGVLMLSEGIVPDDVVGVYTLKGEVVALAVAQMSAHDVLNTEEGISALVKRVLMSKGTYPKGW